MSKRRREPPSDRLEVSVPGSVSLGAELTLLSDDPFHGNTAQDGRRLYAENSSVAPTDSHRSAPPRRALERRTVAHRLEPAGGSVPIAGQGLVLQYGILGAPGSGKTNLLMHVLRQVIVHRPDDEACRYGGLILDPKAALIDEVQEIFHQAGRAEDLIVINEQALAGGGVNIIDCALSPSDLGEALVLAARSAGIGASEPFWLQQMSKVLAGIIALMRFRNPRQAPTLAQVIDFAIGRTLSGNAAEPKLRRLIDGTRRALETREAAQSAALAEDARVALETLERYLARTAGGDGEQRHRQVVEQIIEQAFSMFRLSENAGLSEPAPAEAPSLYDQTIEKGKFLLVSVGPQKLTLARMLPSLTKLLFQRTVLSRFDRYRAGDPRLRNIARPLLFLADEYHTVATQLEGVPFGDSEFFSQARQFGALCLIASQSVEQLRRSSLGESWQAVFATLAAVIFMRGQDPSTRAYLRQLAGDREVRVQRRDRSLNQGKEGSSWSVERSEEAAIPAGLLESFVLGDAVIIGTTEGNRAPTSIRYAAIPRWQDAAELDHRVPQPDPGAQR